MAVEIRTVETKKDIKRYVNFALDLYKGDKFYVPGIFSDEISVIDPDKNPAFKTATVRSWLAYRGKKIVGRITGIHIPLYKEIWGGNNARFGWVDFIDDSEVVQVLFSTMEQWAKDLGAERVTGPQGFTDMDPEGMLVEGFNELGTLPMIYNYEYYPEHLEVLGYRKDVDWLEFELKAPEHIPEKVARVQDLVLKKNKLRMVDTRRSKDFLPYAEGIFKLIDVAFHNLYGVIPPTREQVDVYINQYIRFVDTRFSKIVVNKKNEVIALGIAMPSFSRALQKCRGRLFPFGWYHMLQTSRKPKGIDLYIVAVAPEYQSSGVISIIMGTVLKKAIALGVKTGETSGELENNTKIQTLWRSFEHRQHKRRRCYIKELT